MISDDWWVDLEIQEGLGVVWWERMAFWDGMSGNVGVTWVAGSWCVIR